MYYTTMAGLCTILVLLLLASIAKAAGIDLYSQHLDIERIVTAQGKRITELEGTVTYQEKEITKLHDIIKVLQLSDKDVGTIPEKDDGNYSKDVDAFGYIFHLEPEHKKETIIKGMLIPYNHIKLEVNLIFYLYRQRLRGQCRTYNPEIQ